MFKSEKFKENKVIKTVIFITVFATSFLYLVWRFLFTLPVEYGAFSLFWGVLLWFSEGMAVIETFSHFYNVFKLKLPEMPAISADTYPDIDILICTHNETPELLVKILNGCHHMLYPDKSKVHVYLCDDTNRPEVKALAEKMRVGYFGFEGNKHAKAGNINYGFERTTSPLVAIFDADMIPRDNFLLETVPYFFVNEMIKDEGTWRKRTADEIGDEKPLGYVQTRQSFYNPDTLQRNLYLENNAPNEQDYFYRSVNVARTHVGAAAFAGSNTVFSRQALEDAGGLATYSITEDLATSIEIISAGYQTLAVDKELAHGLSPEDTVSLVKQRQRWSRGSAQVIPTWHFIKSKMPLKAKWSFLVSYLYWWTFLRRMVFILCPILYGLFGTVVAKMPLWDLFVYAIPYYIIYNLGMKFMSGGTISSLWCTISDTVQFPYLVWPIIAGTIKIPEKKFWVTPKDKVKGRNSVFCLGIPHLLLVIASFISGAVCVHNIIFDHYEGAAIVLFWLCYNLFALIYSVLYYYGRVNDSDYEIIPAEVPAVLSLSTGHIHGTTVEISENLLTVALDQPEYINADEPFNLRLNYHKYEATMQVTLKTVHEYDNRWQYTFDITGISEADQLQYLQIIYDRDHAFAAIADVSFVKIIKLVFTGMFKNKPKETNLFPTIDVDCSLYVLGIGDVAVSNYDYQHIIVHEPKAEQLPKRLTVTLPSGVEFNCIKATNSEQPTDNQKTKYEIHHWQDHLHFETIKNYFLAHIAKKTELHEENI